MNDPRQADEDGVSARQEGLPSARFRWPSVLLLFSLFHLAAVALLLLSPGIPLGIPGEWVWRRNPAPLIPWHEMTAALLIAAGAAAGAWLLDRRAFPPWATYTAIAGLSAAGPLAWLVTVSTQMSRPSWLLPALWMDSSWGWSCTSWCRMAENSS